MTVPPTVTACGLAAADAAAIWHAVWQWLREHDAVLAGMFALSIGSLVLAAVLLPVLVARLPADYFVASRRQLRAERSVSAWALRIAKNLLGVVFVLAGILMLVLPGQGLLTILIGLLLLDFPGKRALELRLIRRPALRAFLDRMREKRGRPPLRVE